MYPRLLIDYQKIVHNVKIVKDLCAKNGVNLMGVSKCLLSSDEIVEAYLAGGVDYIADSRIENLMNIKQDCQKVLLRLPDFSKLDLIVKYSDISLNSNLSTVKLLNETASKLGVVHKIILMIDVGDLREGIFYRDDYISLVKEILLLKNIELYGVGMNVTCFGAIIPTTQTLQLFNQICERIEQECQITINIKSFGNSSSLYLLNNNEDLYSLNNLRVGEALLLGKETAYGKQLKDTYHDAFCLEVQLIEVYDKPTKPEGVIGVDAFGQAPVFEDLGVVKRGILAIGRQDVTYDLLTPRSDNVKIIGASSDHMIVLLKGDYQVGDILHFDVSYGSLLSLMNSKFIEKEYINGVKG